LAAVFSSEIFSDFPKNIAFPTLKGTAAPILTPLKRAALWIAAWELRGCGKRGGKMGAIE